MTTALSHHKPGPTTFAERFGVAGLTATVREITKTLTGAVPRHPSIASLRADVMSGKTKPVEHLLRLAFAAVDLGSPVEKVTLWVDDFKNTVQQYALRRERRQGLGILPADQVHVRLVTRSIREDCESDAATAGVDLDSVESLEKARGERLEAIAHDQRLAELYTGRIAELRTR